MNTTAQTIAAENKDLQTYSPNTIDGYVAPVPADRATGALAVTDRAKSPATDGLVAYVPDGTTVAYLDVRSTSLTYVYSEPIDLDNYEWFSYVPWVTEIGGTIARQRLQWSFDATNWFYDTDDTFGTVASGEIPLNQNIKYKDVPSAATGLKDTCARTERRRGRYVRIAQRSDGAVNVTTRNYVQLL